METQEVVRCLVADDHAAMRDGLSAILAAQQDIEVVGQARDGNEALRLTERRNPDVAVLDIRMPGRDGLEYCRALREAGSKTSVILYTAFADRDLLEAGLEAGARAFVLKSAPAEDIVRAVRTVAAGQPYVDVALTQALLERRTKDDTSLLSDREREVLQLLADGRTTDRAAQELFLSPATVRSYVENAMQKLQAHNRTHAVAEAVRQGIID
jgi:DNA-binding NarL/FixJ family response regulator